MAEKRIAKARDGGSGGGVGEAAQAVYLMDDDELDRLIEETARAALNCSPAEAYERLARGELRGTAVADDLYMLRSLRMAS